MKFTEGFGMGLEMLWNIVLANPFLIGILAFFFTGTGLLGFHKKTMRHNKLKKSGILNVDEMTGREFEEYLRILFRERGYQVQLTPTTGDFGADLILSAKNQKVVVQAKRYKKNVGLKAVQEVSTAKSHFNADECWVVTNSYYTEPAKKLAASNRVRLVDRELLMKWMFEMKKSDEAKSAAVE
ncbi:restriction endonuclease [Metaplanococcus flavidus]|uniref:Restriction endonuclease n=1 Tax=Metaplanococcus flavidus TaxID=569883 RepID=A0ABW3L728_9BACL